MMACRHPWLRSSLALLATLCTPSGCSGGDTVIEGPSGDGKPAQSSNSGATGAGNAGVVTGSSSGTGETGGSSGAAASSSSGASDPSGASSGRGDAASGGPVGGSTSNSKGKTDGGSSNEMGGSPDGADASASTGSYADGSAAASGTGVTGSATQVCTSGIYWSGLPGPTMDPGDTCPSCHSSFDVAGTVYPTADEPTGCEGVTGSTLSVVITDASGKVQTLPVNATGNFYSTKAVVFPFHAKVISSTGERDMMAAQSNGDCNYCHTPTGFNGAPGRIMAP